MNNHRLKSKKVKKIPPPPGPEASYDEIIAYHSKYTLDELERAGHAVEPLPDELIEGSLRSESPSGPGVSPMPLAPHPNNAPGPFYVENDMCISCAAPEAEAPDLMGHVKEDYHCYFKKQPSTPEELNRAINAVAVSCCKAVRYGGTDPAILQRLAELCSVDSCDALQPSEGGDMATIIDSPPPKKPVPPLQSGDRLTRDEFERRYTAMPENVKAELLEGVVYLMSSPVCDEFHGHPHFRLVTWLGVYEAATPGVKGGDNSTLRLAGDNEPQADGFLRILPEYGGQCRTAKDGYIEGSPDLIGEVSASSVAIDLGAKFRVYRLNSVKEYIVWRVYEQAIDWFVLYEGQYQAMQPDKDGIYRSRVFPGLWLDHAALIGGNAAQVISVLQLGLASDEHAAFVKVLEEQRE